MALPAIAIPIGLKIGSALANHFSNKRYEKKAKKAAKNDALVAALSQGQVQSNSLPDYKPSKLGAALGFAGDAVGLYQMLGGMATTPTGESGSGIPDGEITPGDPSEMASNYGKSRVSSNRMTGPIGRMSTEFVPPEAFGSSFYGPKTPEDYQDPRRTIPGQQFIDPAWQNQRSNYGPAAPSWRTPMFSPQEAKSLYEDSYGSNVWLNPRNPDYLNLPQNAPSETTQARLRQLFNSFRSRK